MNQSRKMVTLTRALAPPTDESLRHLAFTLRTPRATLQRYVSKGLMLLQEAADKMLAWPTAAEQAQLALEFEAMCGLPHIIGAVDCSHIAIMPRASELMFYTNRKRYYSVHLLAVVDASGRFLYIDVGCAGSMADPTVLKGSDLVRAHLSRVENDDTPLIEFGKLILADGGFAQLPWLLQSYTAEEEAAHAWRAGLNGRIGRGRGIVERAFGQMKNRFKRIGGRSSCDRKERVVQMVKACCALQNLTINMEVELGAPRVLVGDTKPTPPAPDIIMLQRQFTVPRAGAAIGRDQAMLQAARDIRDHVAHTVNK